MLVLLGSRIDLLAITFGRDLTFGCIFSCPRSPRKSYWLKLAEAGERSMISKPISQVIEIPDASLNERLVPANDNHEWSALSRENFEAESILAPRDYIKPSKSPLIVAVVFFALLAAFLFFAAWNH